MSRELARDVAIARGAYLPIVMATIEAETNFRNVLGEYAAPSAVWGAGFGQVHLRWHLATFRQVAAELGITLPADLTERRDPVQRYVIDNMILKNDLLSMHLAVAVIDRIWRDVRGDWDAFTSRYVGAGIPARDRERRRRIWERWRTAAQQPPPVAPHETPPVVPPMAPPAVPVIAPMIPEPFTWVFAFGLFFAFVLVIRGD